MGINEKLAKEIETLILEDRFGYSVSFYIPLSFNVCVFFLANFFGFLNHLSFASSRLDRIHLRRYNEYSEREILRWVFSCNTDVALLCLTTSQWYSLQNHLGFVLRLEYSPSTNVAWVLFPALVSYAGWVYLLHVQLRYVFSSNTVFFEKKVRPWPAL